MQQIARRVLTYYRRNARKLPWRRERPDPYAVWVSGIMAQQTRLPVVVPYWERWMDRFPTVRALAQAPLDEVLTAWAGLGYYARARSLHACAREVVTRYDGALPSDPEELASLPGIGPYTAGAIASIAFAKQAPLVDGNVARILARVYGIEDDVRAPATVKKLWELAAALVPGGAPSGSARRGRRGSQPPWINAPGDFNQGLMDLGATVCTPRSPTCLVCPLADLCVAKKLGRQEDLPRIARRGATPVVEVVLAWVVRGGRWLLGRRAPTGLYGGMWELPEAASLPRVTLGDMLAAHTQQLTHRRIEYRLHAARFTRRVELGPPYDTARFVHPAQLGSLALSSAMTALARTLRETTWPTPTAHSRSFPKGTRRSSRGSAP